MRLFFVWFRFRFCFLTGRKCQKCYQFLDLFLRNHFFHNYELELFHQSLKQHLFWSRIIQYKMKSFNNKMMNNDLCDGILIVHNCQKGVIISTSRFSNFYFSITLGFTSAIKVSIDKFFPIEGASN